MQNLSGSTSQKKKPSLRLIGRKDKPKNESKKGRKGSADLSPSGRPKNVPVFGTPLQTILSLQKQQSGCSHLCIPFLMKECINFIVRTGLDTEGLFRISGDVMHVNKVKADYNDQLSFDDVEELRMDKKVDNVHEATALFKQFLREQPNPLLTYQLAEPFSQALDSGDHETRILTVKNIIARLPEENQYLLSSVLRLLHVVTCNSTYNMMDSDNISRLIGPNLLWSQTTEFSMDLMVKVNALTLFMIEHVEQLFDPPTSSFSISTKPEPAVLLRKFAGHVKSVLFLARTFDHRYVWSADSRAVIRIYDTHTLRQLKELDTGAKNIYSMKDVDGVIWLGSAAGIQARHAAAGDLLCEIPGAVYSLAYVDQSVWAGADQKIHIWSRDYQKEGEIDIGVNVPVFSLLRVGNTVWAACLDNCIRVFDIQSKNVVKQFPAHKKKINTMLNLPNGQIWTCSDDATIGIWDSSTYELQHTITGHNGYVYGLTLIGTRVWSCSWDKRILVWDVKTYALVDELPAYHNDAVSAVLSCQAQDGHAQVWSSSWDKSVIVWSVSDTPLASPVSSSSSARPSTVLVDVEALVGNESSALLPGALDALNGMLAKQLDVRIWLGAPTCDASLMQRIEWVSHQLGESWVERIVIVADRKLVATDVIITVPGKSEEAEENIIHFIAEAPLPDLGSWANWPEVLGF